MTRSWGGRPDRSRGVHRIRWTSDVLPPVPHDASLLPQGLARSYGDSCLNDGGLLLETRSLDRFLDLDAERGLVRAEAGVSLAEVLDLVVPLGWFLPVTPGTKHVTLGGAIANDVHGKDHHVSGTFGRHVTRFELLRSDGSRRICSPAQHADLFAATIGGLGLTGLITWAEFQLVRIPSSFVAMETVRFDGLDGFFALSTESNATHPYAVAWVDTFARGDALGRGLFMRGAFTDAPRGEPSARAKRTRLSVPIVLPDAALHPFAVATFNHAYFHKQLAPSLRRVVPYEPFFYPLDSIAHWNRLYGRRGFYQYQCVVPFEEGHAAMRAILRACADAREASFLSVLKTFGDLPSPGLLSFPMPGVTLALDFPDRGARTLALLDRLDALVREAGGRVYPAKDARMSPETFRASYPTWERFVKHVDPAFSSSFWRRVTA